MKRYKHALITGGFGQDAYFLLKLLSKKNYKVSLLVRKSNTSKKKELLQINSKIKVINYDILKDKNLEKILAGIKYTHIFNLASMTSGIKMSEQPKKILHVNGTFVLDLLEYIRNNSPKTRLFHASSFEIFGNSSSKKQNETTAHDPRSIYGAAKVLAQNFIVLYRKRYNIFASSGIFYNHESSKRREEFLSRKISIAASRIKLGLSNSFQLEGLDTRRDWGFAGDYMDAAFKIINLSKPDDYIVASGKSRDVATMCEIAFNHIGLDYKDYLILKSDPRRATDNGIFCGDTKKLKQHTGWKPSKNFKQMIQEMVEYDLKNIK